MCLEFRSSEWHTSDRQASGEPLNQTQELSLYSVASQDDFDTMCGTTGASAYANGGQKACTSHFLPGILDTDFEKCLQAIDCQMNKEMRIKGFDSHQSHIVTFMQQMIPHHVNAVNMAKMLLKHAPSEVVLVEDLEDILWSMVNVQNYQIHQMRNYLAGHAGYGATVHDGIPLLATSVGEHCDSALDVAVDIAGSSPSTSPTASVPGCTPSATTLCMKVNLFAGETGYYEFAGHTGPSPDIEVRIGQTPATGSIQWVSPTTRTGLMVRHGEVMNVMRWRAWVSCCTRLMVLPRRAQMRVTLAWIAMSRSSSTLVQLGGQRSTVWSWPLPKQWQIDLMLVCSTIFVTSTPRWVVESFSRTQMGPTWHRPLGCRSQIFRNSRCILPIHRAEWTRRVAPSVLNPLQVVAQGSAMSVFCAVIWTLPLKDACRPSTVRWKKRCRATLPLIRKTRWRSLCSRWSLITLMLWTWQRSCSSMLMGRWLTWLWRRLASQILSCIKVLQFH